MTIGLATGALAKPQDQVPDVTRITEISPTDSREPQKARGHIPSEPQNQSPVSVSDAPPQAPPAQGGNWRESQRADDDLEAQQSMADAAWWIVRLTVGQIILGVATLIGLGVTIYYTHDTARSGQASAKAAQESAREAAHANKLAKEDSARQFDPTLFIESMDVSGANSNPLELRYWITAVVRNGGMWPAFIQRRDIVAFTVRNGQVVGASGSGGWGLIRRLASDEPMTLEFGTDGPVNPDDLYFYGIRLTYDTLSSKQKFCDFWLWLRMPPEFEDAWADRVVEPAWVRNIPAFFETPWTQSREEGGQGRS